MTIDFNSSFYSYECADERAVAQVNSGKFRIVFVCADLSRGNTYDWCSYAQNFYRPIKRYRRLSNGAIEVKVVTSWRRN